MRLKIRAVVVVVGTLALIAGPALEVRAQAEMTVKGATAQPADEQDAHEMQQAEEVSKRHTAELLKIHHVRKVVAEHNAQKEIAILVQVDDPKYIDEVTNKLPSQIEGFPVDVDATFTARAGGASDDDDSDIDLGEGFSVDTGFAKKPSAKSDDSSD